MTRYEPERAGFSKRSEATGSSKSWIIYTIAGLYVLLATVMGLHGSSLGVYSGHYPNAHQTIVGTPRSIRSDEWNIQTPDILYQLFRVDKLSSVDGPVGPGHSALLFNLPTAHLTTIFRPQLWPFFVLSAEHAFSLYWQLKIALLVVGVFALVHLITERTGISVALSLFLFFSPYMQWGFSWPSGLPEMVGSACLAVTLVCRSLVSRGRLFMFSASVGAGLFATNFVLFAYPPHQVSVAWAAVAVFIWWVISRWKEIAEYPFWHWRAMAVTAGVVVLMVGLLSFFLGASAEIAAAANTVYPGQRRGGAGGVSVLAYASYFLDFFKTEADVQSKFGNICEASGYFFFGPLTFILAHRLTPGPARTLYMVLIGVFTTLAAWIFLPVPSWLGIPFGLDLAGAQRLCTGLGLLNVLILAAFLASYRDPLPNQTCLTIAAVAFACAVMLFHYVNVYYELGLRIRQVAISALFVATVLGFIAANLRVGLGILLVAPLALSMGLVNPVDRGLDVIMRSDLWSFLRDHQDLRRQKWFFFVNNDEIVGPDFFTAHGLDVFSSFHVVPDLAAMRKLDPSGQAAANYNASGWFLGRESPEGQDIIIEHMSAGSARIRISPLDGRLADIGISILVFNYKPAPENVKGLEQLSDTPINGYWLYRIQR